ncbi:MAG: peptidylprolyl isomerase [Gammaproteobacteria bacterium]|nr:peptidylprolyl isomerase [Gammaproteobacteria bacterium]MDH5652902.1 peptidylprolyl isomerase [Gammaproteobacteria bacterium]
MRKIIIAVTVLLALGHASMLHALPMGVAALVNGKEISSIKLQKAVDGYLQQQGTNIGSIRDPNKFQQVQEKVLDILIGQNLLWQKAEADKQLATDDEVEKLYQQYQAQYPSKEAFETKMKIEGFDEKTYRQELKHQLSAKKWVHANVLSKVKVEAADIDKFYNDNIEKFKAPEMVSARHILIGVKEGAADKEKKAARKKLQKIKQQIDKGADFAEMAKQHSTGPSAPHGGNLGLFPRGKMVKAFEDAAFKLKKGQVSKIVETKYGYHIIKVEDKQPARTVSKVELAERIHQHLLQLKSEEALQTAIDDLRKEARVEVNLN